MAVRGPAGHHAGDPPLLDHWHAEDRFRPLFFCQVEALETLIFITEVAKQTKYGQDWIEKYLKEKAAEAGTDLFRVACKMATGSGKTVVMSMLVAWQVLNKRRHPHDNRFTDAFLAVAPGITVRDRFKLREKGDAGGLTKRVLTANTPGAFTESPDEMVNRVCNDLGRHREIMVINDEAHHCYRGKPAEAKEKMTKEEASEAPAYDLFADFDGIDNFSKKLEFYRHDQHWTNRLILGDSLLVMASLAEKERLRGKVQCVYFDPPYGIKFGSNWQVSTRKRDVKDAKAEDLTRQPEQIKAFRDTWELGIHSYLSYMRDRLAAARDLLTDSGSIFVQIGDENVHLVRCLLDEVFGSENAICQIVCRKTAGATSEYLPPTTDHILWYGKDRDHTKYHPLYLTKGVAEGGADPYDKIELSDGTRRRATSQERNNPELLPKNCRVYRHQIVTSPRVREARSGYFPVTFNGKDYYLTTRE